MPLAVYNAEGGSYALLLPLDTGEADIYTGAALAVAHVKRTGNGTFSTRIGRFDHEGTPIGMNGAILQKKLFREK
ncbi:MAG: hypothetical protein HYW25_04040 [Candidatus Aenigmarchaeota archaeon]|nr:hypothetical protein [Candidatus Aenigmarchaeota archaeon]